MHTRRYWRIEQIVRTRLFMFCLASHRIADTCNVLCMCVRIMIFLVRETLWKQNERLQIIFFCRQHETAWNGTETSNLIINLHVLGVGFASVLFNILVSHAAATVYHHGKSHMAPAIVNFVQFTYLQRATMIHNRLFFFSLCTRSNIRSLKYYYNIQINLYYLLLINAHTYTHTQSEQTDSFIFSVETNE